MAKVSRPTIHFMLKNRPDKQGLCSVIALIRFNGRAERAAGVKVTPAQWDPARELVRRSHPNCRSLNAQLASLRQRLESSAAELLASGAPVTAKMVASGIDSPSKGGMLTVGGAFSLYVSEKSLRRGTVDAYNQSLRRFMRFSRRDPQLAEVTPRTLSSWMQCLEREGVGSLTRSQYGRCFCAVMRHANERTGMPLEPHLFDRAVRSISRQVGKRRTVLSRENIDVLLGWVGGFSDAALCSRATVQSRAAVWLCSYALCGLAPIDMSLLRVGDLAFGEGKMTVRGFRRKTGRAFQFTVPTGPLVEVALMPFVRTAFRRQGFIFPILRGGCMSDVDVSDEGAVSKAVKRYSNHFKDSMGEAIGAATGGTFEGFPRGAVTLYSARHSFASNFAQRSSNLRALATAMGRSVNTLGTYVHELTGEDEMLEETMKVF